MTLPLGARSRRGALAGARALASSTWFLGALVFVLTWGGSSVTLHEPSIDNSLNAGLNMAAMRGFDFGTDIVFTYGPLGFLKSYLVFYEWPARLAGAYGIALHLALSVSLVWALRRSFGTVIAIAAALAIAVYARGEESLVTVRDDAAVIALAVIWCFAALSREAPEWTRKLVVLAGGPFVALELLTKLNTGIVVAAAIGITAIAIEGARRRNLTTLGLGFLGSATVLWFAAGQGIDDIGPYLSGSLDVISGYSVGARLDWTNRDYDYAVIPVLIAATAAIAWLATRGLPWLRRGAMLLIVGLVSFTAMKGGLVSHDSFHMATFYATMLGVLVAIPLSARPGLRLGTLATLVAGVAAATTTHSLGYPMLNPLENARNGVETVARLVDEDSLDAEIATNRSTLRSEYGLDPRSLALLEGSSVHVEPSEAAAAWAYELDWRPLPVFQPYAAWTPELDHDNAAALGSPEGPERVLRQDLNALGRYPAYESPAAMLALLCNFRAARTTGEWQVLERVPDRCAEPRSIGVAEGTYGTAFEVPTAPANEIVFARPHGLEVSGLERVRNALVRARGRQVTFANDSRLYTLIATTAKDGLILRAPRAIDFPEPFALAPNAATVTFLFEGGPADRPLRVEFFSMPVKR